MKLLTSLSLFLGCLFQPAMAQTDLFGEKQVLFHVTTLNDADRGFVCGDFNGDGLLDFGGLVAEGLTMFLHNGDLTYDTMLARASFELPVSAADMNNDGKADLVSSDAYYALDESNEVVRHVFNFNGFHKIRFAKDLNADGFAEVLSELDEFGEDPVMYLHKNVDGITFESVVLDNTRTNYDFALATDFTRNGRTDILIGDQFGQRIYVYMATPGGSFLKSLTNVSQSVAGTFLSAADLDGDKDIDILPGTGTRFESLYFLENVNSNFSSVREIQSLSGAMTTELFDLDSDGDQDVICMIQRSTYELGYILNEGNGNWGPFIKLDNSNVINPLAYANPNLFDNWLHVNDVDGDGKNDIIVSAHSSGEIRWYKGLFTSAVESESAENSTWFFPQPATNYLICPDLEGDENALLIWDAGGNTRWEGIAGSGDRIDISALESGVYFFQIQSRSTAKVRTGRFMKVALE
jgi:hypothetical protein